MNKDIYKNILIIVTGLLVLFYLSNAKAFLYSALIIALISSFFPILAGLINWLWMKFAFILGWVNSRILLSIVYFIFLTPIAFLSKIFSKDPMKLRKQKESLFNTRNHTFQKKDLENTW